MGVKIVELTEKVYFTDVKFPLQMFHFFFGGLEYNVAKFLWWIRKYTVTMQVDFGVVRVEYQIKFQLKAFRNNIMFTAILEKSQKMLVPGEFVPSLG